MSRPTKTTFAKAIESTLVYPNGRVTTAHVGFTKNGEHSHIAVSRTIRGETFTFYLCGTPTQSGNLTWPSVDRSNVSCARCKAKAAKKGVFA